MMKSDRVAQLRHLVVKGDRFLLAEEFSNLWKGSHLAVELFPFGILLEELAIPDKVEQFSTLKGIEVDPGQLVTCEVLLPLKPVGDLLQFRGRLVLDFLLIAMRVACDSDLGEAEWVQNVPHHVDVGCDLGSGAASLRGKFSRD